VPVRSVGLIWKLPNPSCAAKLKLCVTFGESGAGPTMGALNVKSVYVPIVLVHGKSDAVEPGGQKELCCSSTYSMESAMVNPHPTVPPGLPERNPPAESKVSDVRLADATAANIVPAVKSWKKHFIVCKSLY
jgi:hypothetical protein